MRYRYEKSERRRIKEDQPNNTNHQGDFSVFIFGGKIGAGIFREFIFGRVYFYYDPAEKFTLAPLAAWKNATGWWKNRKITVFGFFVG